MFSDEELLKALTSSQQPIHNRIRAKGVSFMGAYRSDTCIYASYTSRGTAYMVHYYSSGITKIHKELKGIEEIW